MATKAKPGARPRSSVAKRDIGDGLERVGASLEEVQRVLESMRSDVNAGARDLFDDLDGMVREARKDLGGLTKALRGDVDDLQKAIRKPPARRAARAKSTAGAKR